MTPAELAVLHPRLYHLTTPGAWDRIRSHGLLPASELVARSDLPTDEKDRLVSQPRPGSVELTIPGMGDALIYDNLPMTEAALARCLDDGLTPADWLRMINDRVFFWPTKSGLRSLRESKLNRSRDRVTLVVDTLALAERYLDRLELTPINSGSTIRQPARRGLATFAPVADYSHAQWRRLRRDRGEVRGLDTIKEVVARGGVPDIAECVLDVRDEPAIG